MATEGHPNSALVRDFLPVRPPRSQGECVYRPFFLYEDHSQQGSVGKSLLANAGDTGDVASTPRSGRSPGERDGNPLQCSCLRNPMERGCWQATVRTVANSQTRRSDCACVQACILTRPIFRCASSVREGVPLWDPLMGETPG